MANSRQSRFSLLLVAEDTDERKELFGLLVNSDYDVHCRDSARTSMQFLTANQVDIVLIHCHIRGRISGTAFCTQLYEDQRVGQLPIVMLGRDDEEGSRCVAAMEAGADDFVDLPVIVPVLVARLKRLLSKRPAAGTKSSLSVQTTSGELPGILQYLETELKTGKLQIRSDEDTAVIFMDGGKLVNATSRHCNGVDAVVEVLCWESSHVTFLDVELTPEDRKFESETTGLLMNCVFEVDEYRERASKLPASDAMLLPTHKRLPKDAERGLQGVLEMVQRGFGVDDIIRNEEQSRRKSTLWLCRLLEEEYIRPADPPFENYGLRCHEFYSKREKGVQRLRNIRQMFADLLFPLAQGPNIVPPGHADWMALCPKLVVTGDNMEYMERFIESFNQMYIARRQEQPSLRNRPGGAHTIRYCFSGELVFDIQLLPPELGPMVMPHLDDYLMDAFGVIMLVSSLDKKRVRNSLRLLRLLRQRFVGCYYQVMLRVKSKDEVCEFRMDCDRCGYSLAVDMDLVGSMGECPICNHVLTIPDCLDHLGTQFLLPADVPVVQVEPENPKHCRDLMIVLLDSIFEVLEAPPVPPAPSAVGVAAFSDVPQMQGVPQLPGIAAVPAAPHMPQVPERALVPRVSFADMPQPPSPLHEPTEKEVPLNAVGEGTDIWHEASQFESKGASAASIIDDIFSDEPDTVDEIIRGSEDSFDIDDFIRKVKKKR